MTTNTPETSAFAGYDLRHLSRQHLVAGIFMGDRLSGLRGFRFAVPAAALGVSLLMGDLQAQTVPARGQKASGAGQALIVVGLPGDSEHETLFRETVKSWREWLTGPLGFPRGSVQILFDAGGDAELASQPATRESMQHAVAEIRGRLDAGGRLWVFFLGHANLRENHAYFHLPGPDLSDEDCARMFAAIPCREQVFWITSACSGAFLPGLSTRGRIVITATMAGHESNETEFPHALAEVCRKQASQLDCDGDGKVSVWDLFLRTTEEVEARFQKDQRAPTEHALLDDNGDRKGTERPAKSGPASKAREKEDGTLARQTVIFQAGRDRSP